MDHGAYTKKENLVSTFMQPVSPHESKFYCVIIIVIYIPHPRNGSQDTPGVSHGAYTKKERLLSTFVEIIYCLSVLKKLRKLLFYFRIMIQLHSTQQSNWCFFK